MITFNIPGVPVAQGRPRFTTVNGNPRAYDPEKSSEYKIKVGWEAKRHCAEPLSGAVEVGIQVFVPIPKGFSKKRVLSALAGDIRPTTRPDSDNYGKIIIDACNGILWRDDAQVVDLNIRKWYSDNPRVEVVVEWE